MKGTVLVTGAGGFAGSHLVNLLRSEGETVVAVHRPGPHGAAVTDGDGIERRGVDMLDRASIEALVAEVQPVAIYHCAASAHAGQSWQNVTATHETNVLGTHYLLEAVRKAAVSVTVLIPGSALLYRDSAEPIDEDSEVAPRSPYALSKLAQEMLGRRAFEEDGIRVLVPRAFNHIGPGQHESFVASAFARQVAAIEAGLMPAILRVGNLDARRDLTDVRDTVRAYRMLVERGQPGRIYNVCRGETFAIRDLLDGLLARSIASVDVVVDPDRLRPNDVQVIVGNPRRMREEIGWRATIPLEETMNDLLVYWRGKVSAP